MKWSGLSPTEEFLGESAYAFFRDQFGASKISIGQEIDASLNWRPTFFFRREKYNTVAVEVGNSPYPAILKMSHAQIVNTYFPIEVYSVCLEDSYLKNQQEVKELFNHGYGLLTIDQDGLATLRKVAIPLIQHISKSEFERMVKGFSKKQKARLNVAYSIYENRPISGVQDVTELVEKLTFETASKLVRKGLLSSTEASGATAKVLDNMSTKPSLGKQKSAIAGFRSYVTNCRNLVHHHPKTKDAAYKKNCKCAEFFREGIQKIENFKEEFKKNGITVSF